MANNPWVQFSEVTLPPGLAGSRIGHQHPDLVKKRTRDDIRATPDVANRGIELLRSMHLGGVSCVNGNPMNIGATTDEVLCTAVETVSNAPNEGVHVESTSGLPLCR